MRATEVFKPQGTPTITLVRDTPDAEASQAFDDAIEEKGKLIRVVGPSKSGKTVFVATKAGSREIIRVSASGIQDGRDLWNRVLASAGAEVERKVASEVTGTVGIEMGGKASAGIIFAKAEAEGKGKGEFSKARSVEIVHAADPLQAIVKTFSGGVIWIFIDDFHYASAEVRAELSEQIKFVAEENVQLIIALIPGRSEDILQKNPDLQGRIVDIPFSYWDINELALIAESGFPHLGVRLDPGSSKLIANEAAGTPQLMQGICLEIAREFGARDKIDPPRHFHIDAALLEKVCQKLATNGADYSTTIEQMRNGPPTRGNARKSYPDADGRDRDVYDLIISAFKMDPPQLKFTTAELETRVNSLAGQSVASVWESVRHISEIANNMSGEKKIDFGAELRWVSILDPYLFFALRWS